MHTEEPGPVNQMAERPGVGRKAVLRSVERRLPEETIVPSLSRLSVRAKLYLGFSLILLALAVIGGLGIRSIGSVNGISREISGDWLPSTQALGALNSAGSDYRLSVFQHMLAADDKARGDLDRQLAARSEIVEKMARVYEPLVSSPEERALYDEYRAVWKVLMEGVAKVLDLSRANQRDEAVKTYNQAVRPSALKSKDLIEKLVALNGDGAKRAVEHSEQVSGNAFSMIAGLLVAAILLGIATAFVISRSISRGIARVIERMQSLAAGDLAVEVPFLGERTELGRIGEALQQFKLALLDKEHSDEAARLDREAKARRVVALERLTGDFEAKIGRLATTLSGAAGTLQNTAATMTSAAGEADQRSMAVGSASEQASANVQTVATATEELSASIREIGSQIAQSTDVAARAVSEARRTEDTVHELAAAAQKIGEIVALINGIAAQTNLLALNATIEAARAGEAGKGFAVVASEVKALANQTSQATEEISTQINAIQGATESTVNAMGSIGTIIRDMNEITAMIASAIEEQAAATQEISRNVQQAAVGTQEVTRNIEGVRSAAGETGSAANDVLSAAGALALETERLGTEVSSFLTGVKAA